MCTVCEKGHFLPFLAHCTQLQGFQIEAFQQRYLKCKCETPYLEAELVPKTCKNWKMSFKKKFLSGLVTKLENLLVFGKTL